MAWPSEQFLHGQSLPPSYGVRIQRPDALTVRPIAELPAPVRSTGTGQAAEEFPGDSTTLQPSRPVNCSAGATCNNLLEKDTSRQQALQRRVYLI